MYERLWLGKTYGPSSIQDCLDLANRWGWNISVVHRDNGEVWVLTGDQAIFHTDNTDAAEAFLYGIGLAYSSVPDEIWAQDMKSLGYSDDELREMGYNKAPDSNPTE